MMEMMKKTMEIRMTLPQLPKVMLMIFRSPGECSVVFSPLLVIKWLA